MISKNLKRKGRWLPRRHLFLATAILPCPLYALGALLLPVATFSGWTLMLVLWTALVSAFAILGVKTPGVWKFNIVAALIGLPIWFLFYITNGNGDALNYNSTVILITLSALLFGSAAKRVTYPRASARISNPRRGPLRTRTAAARSYL